MVLSRSATGSPVHACRRARRVAFRRHIAAVPSPLLRRDWRMLAPTSHSRSALRRLRPTVLDITGAEGKRGEDNGAAAEIVNLLRAGWPGRASDSFDAEECGECPDNTAVAISSPATANTCGAGHRPRATDWREDAARSMTARVRGTVETPVHCRGARCGGKTTGHRQAAVLTATALHKQPVRNRTAEPNHTDAATTPAGSPGPERPAASVNVIAEMKTTLNTHAYAAPTSSGMPSKYAGGSRNASAATTKPASSPAMADALCRASDPQTPQHAPQFPTRHHPAHIIALWLPPRRWAPDIVDLTRVRVEDIQLFWKTSFSALRAELGLQCLGGSRSAVRAPVSAGMHLC